MANPRFPSVGVDGKLRPEHLPDYVQQTQLDAAYATRDDIVDVIESMPSPGIPNAVASVEVRNIIAVAQGSQIPPIGEGDLVVLYTPPQTTYFTDFSEYEVGLAPDDWSLPWSVNADTLTVEESAEATGGKRLRIHAAVANTIRAAVWGAVPHDPLRSDMEIVFRWRTNRDDRLVRGALGISGDVATGRYGLTTGAVSSTRLGGSAWIGESFSRTEFISSPYTTEANTWYWSRIRVDTTQQRAWVRQWRDDEAEPNTWNATGTESVLTVAGLPGVATYTYTGQSEILELDVFGVGIGGATAPKVAS